MSDFSAGKQKKGVNAFDMFERDAPFDAAREWEESRFDRPELTAEGRFAQFYLEQQNQKSNVYFAHHQRAHALPQWRRTIPYAPFVSRFSFLWRVGAGVFGGVALFALIGAAWWWSGNTTITSVFSGARGVYADMLSAQQSFAQLHFESSMFGFHAVHTHVAQQEHNRQALAAYAQGALSFVLHREEVSGDGDALALEQAAIHAADALGEGMEPLFQISSSSFFHTSNAEEHVTAGTLIDEALAGVEDARAAFGKVQTAYAAEEQGLPDDVRVRASALMPQLSLVAANAEKLIAHLKLAVWALGMERPRKFIVVAQNSAIARPTGGAIRSVGVVTTQGGSITRVSFDDVYGIDGQLQVNMVPPEPIQKSATAWALHDANWFFDFPLSAKKIAYFYGKSGGGDVDGVLAVNDHALKKILALTGPVKGDDGVPVNGENHERLTQKDVLRAIAEIFPTFSGANARALVQIFQEGLREKDIMLWLTDRDYQEMIAQEGWSGEVMRDAGADYLAVVASDIGGDAMNIKEDIWKETHIAENGDIVNTVAAQFIPVGNAAGAGHERYVRIYVPMGAELLDASGITAMKTAPQIDYLKERFIVDEDLTASEHAARADAFGARIFEESGKTVFAGWTTGGGKSDTVIVRYRLPFSFMGEATRAPMTFIFQKQPGVSAGIHFSLVVPEGMQATDAEGGDLSAFSADGTTDVIIHAHIK